jgi:CTP:molybdopterin cytidylyltransferase MocA
VIAAVVLAAGAAVRMGRNKALLPLPDGRRFIDAIVESARAAGVAEVVVVVAAPHDDAIRAAPPPAVVLVDNPAPERGMLSSVQCGLAALSPAALGALVWPVDTPAVRTQTVRRLLLAAPDRIVVPTAGGRGGHPLYLPRAVWPKVAALPTAGDSPMTLRDFVRAHAAAVLRLELDDPGVSMDIDTPADYERARLGTVSS